MVLREIGEDHGAQSGLTTNGNNFVLKSLYVIQGVFFTQPKTGHKALYFTPCFDKFHNMKFIDLVMSIHHLLQRVH